MQKKLRVDAEPRPLRKIEGSLPSSRLIHDDAFRTLSIYAFLASCSRANIFPGP